MTRPFGVVRLATAFAPTESGGKPPHPNSGKGSGVAVNVEQDAGSTAVAARKRALVYRLHGLRIEARAVDPQLAAAMEGLFHRFALPRDRGHAPGDAVTCLLERVDRLPDIVPSESRLLYQQGDALRCSAAGHRIFIEVRGLSVGEADLEGRRLRVYVARGRDDFLWSLQHFSILPLVMEFLRLRGIYPIHGAAMEWKGRALILPALPGSGKSTLSIALLRAGLRLLSDDMPFLTVQDGVPQLLAFPEDINVCTDGVGFFEELSFLADRTPNERNKHSFPVDSLFPGGLAERGRPRLLVFPRIARTPTSLLTPMAKAEAFLALLQHSLPPLNRALASAHFATMMDTAASCECYRLETGVNPEEAAGQLTELLRGVP